ncbi:LysR family transcriptional regulator, partial [bacterium]|nr:LysR family transcriptional regulator [bacterium]
MNHLNYHHLFYFLTVCQEGGFTRAALKLRLSQSAVSEQVRKLEEILGQRLIAR